MQVGDEDKRDGRERDEGRQRGHRFVRVDLQAERVDEAEHLRRARRQSLEREKENAGEDPDHAADQEFDGDQPEGEDRIVAKRGARDLVDQERRQRKRDRERDEEPDLHGDLAASRSPAQASGSRRCGRTIKTRRSTPSARRPASPSPASRPRRRSCGLVETVHHEGHEETRSLSCPLRSWWRKSGVHEIVPSDFTSNPRATSSCERMASVGNMRSMIMRT